MKDKITQENRKAFPKYMIVVLAAALGGGLLGFCGGILGIQNLENAQETILKVLGVVVPWGIPLILLTLVLPSWLLYRRANTMFQSWDGEEEELPRKAEEKLSYGLLFSNLAFILACFFLSASHMAGTNQGMILTVGLYCLNLVLVIFLQQKIVDLIRRMNPEKQGSVYDLKFHKKWLESCDEAERAKIGQASYKAYFVATQAAAILWLITVMANFMMGTGLFATLPPLILWAILQVVYTVTTIKQEQGGDPL